MIKCDKCGSLLTLLRVYKNRAFCEKCKAWIGWVIYCGGRQKISNTALSATSTTQNILSRLFKKGGYPFYLPQPRVFEKKVSEAVINLYAEALQRSAELAVKLFPLFV